ncbi:WXG100 family type VII secretion target [Kitasatospora phosalacinea]|uniref:WXG100 family type VII secretion target n=1 Tax=Kitasatospora phosalacinea TaxID=2065 RepID=UPI002555FB17|nr:WXG100 family type VII secretion target [Kitasatospora phosalacinea]
MSDPSTVGTSRHPQAQPQPHPQPQTPPAGHGGAGGTGRTPTVGNPEEIRPGSARPAGDGGGEAGGGASDEPEAVQGGWFGGALKEAAKNAATGAAGSFGSKAGEWAGQKVFGSSEEPEGGPEGEPESEQPGEGSGGLYGAVRDAMHGQMLEPQAGLGGAVTTMPAYVSGPGARVGTTMPGSGAMPGAGLMGGQSDAYAWARAQIQESIKNLPEAEHKSRGGLSGALDEMVEWALEKSGLLDMLEEVTGNLAELNNATMEWQAQAAAVRSVAAELRSGVMPVAESWAGAASDAFGGHMGNVADALDQTAEEMMQTAQIINSAAQECAMAEGMVIEIITEAIESLIVSLAAEAVLSFVTFGAAAVVGALLDEAEIDVFVARVARVSTKLAKALEELLKALQEMGKAVKATRKLGDISKVMQKMEKVETAFNNVRKLEEGESKVARIAQKIDDKVTEKATGWAEDKIKAGLGIDEEDREGVQRGDGTLKGNLKAAGKSSWGALKEGLTSETNKSAVEQELLNDIGLQQEPDPYRVDRSRIRTAFG